MNVSKKDERLARGLAYSRLIKMNFPVDMIEARVQESWPGYLEQAKFINRCMVKYVGDWELAGSTTDREMKQWSMSE